MMDDAIHGVPDAASAIAYLECGATGRRYEAGRAINLSEAGKPLLARYDLDRAARTLTRENLARRAPTLWRYREVLPVVGAKNVVTLGEAITPLIACPRTAARLKAGPLYVKDESRLPTGSFKARGLVMAVSMAKEFGIRRMAMPTNGNAGAALAAYCRRAGIEAFVFCPEDTPEINVREIALQGAKVWRVNGYIDDCGKIVGAGKEAMGWFDASTLKEPYRIEGKKTMGYELAEQLGWTVPDTIFYPTGGGTGLIGMWKAFDEMQALGLIGAKRPRMIAVQAEGCAPMVRAWRDGAEHATRWENASTIAMGIRVPQAIGDFLILRAVRESGGFAVAVPDAAIAAAQKAMAEEDGLLLCPEGAATLAAYEAALREGLVRANESAMLFNCATGLKYDMPAMDRRLDRAKPIDYRALAGSPT
jgi:threonine synthase